MNSKNKSIDSFRIAFEDFSIEFVEKIVDECVESEQGVEKHDRYVE